MKKLMLFYVAFTLVLSGCGKKKEEAKHGQNDKNQKVALADKGDVPLYKADGNEQLLDEEAVSDFAFVDEDDSSMLKKNESGDVLAVGNKAGSMKDAASLFNEDEALAAHEREEGFERVQFDFDKSSLRNDQKPKVKKDIEVAKKIIQEGKDVVIAGHTCQIGSASYNLALSQRRAEAVKAEMLRAGLPAKKVKTLGYGYEYPLVWSDKVERNEKIKELSPNRRAELASN